MFEYDGFCGVTTLVSHGFAFQKWGCGLPDRIFGRRRADSNRWCSFCRAVPYHLATSPGMGAGAGDRTRDFLLGKEMLYHLATPASQLLSHDKVTPSKMNCQQPWN